MKRSIGFIIYFSFTALLFNSCFLMNKNFRLKKDKIEYSKICDTIQTISEISDYQFKNFNHDELDILKFKIIRNGKILRDTLIDYTKTPIDTTTRKYKALKNVESFSGNKSFYRKIPFKFNKNDTILIITKSDLKFYISGFHYNVYALFHNYGYSGKCGCRLSDTIIVNGNKSNFISSNFRK